MTEIAPDHAPAAPEDRPFLVDLRGVVDLLGRHIYSGPRVYLRELLQNGRDAITARAELEGRLEPAWGVRVHPASAERPEFRFVDDGIGLTAAEVGELLATVGRSSKRDVFDLPREGFLGQFGIGLLSCFMVADRITVRSRSARGGPAVEWVGHAGGTFTVRELTDAESAGLGIGTEVSLVPRPDEAELCSAATVRDLAVGYAEYLPVPILVGTGDGAFTTVNRPPAFAASGAAREAGAAELRALGRELCGAEPFAAIELHAPSTGTRGTAFVLPAPPSPGARQASRVYLGGMLVDARSDALLPDWAFFVRAVVDTSGLRPTASREQLVDDEALEQTRQELGASIRGWVMRRALEAPGRLAEFVGVHHLGLKSLIVHDDELAGFITRWLTVETSIGPLTVDELVRRHPAIRYADTIDEFRQIAGIVPASRPVVNAGYVHDADILQRLPLLFDGVTVERVTVSSELDTLAAPPLAERDAALALEARASTALAGTGCEAVVRAFAPDDLASLYLADAEVLRSIARGAAREVASPLWGRVLGRVDHAIGGRDGDDARPPAAKLCLNWSNPLVRTLAAVDDAAVVDRSIRLLYVQALLAGHRPLRPADRAMLTGALTDLVQLSLAN